MISINIVTVSNAHYSRIIAPIHDIFHSKAAFGGDDNLSQDADISLMLQLSQFDKRPRLKLSYKALPTIYIARFRSRRSAISFYRR